MQTFRKRSKVRGEKDQAGHQPSFLLQRQEESPLGDGQHSATPAPGRAEGSESSSHFSFLPRGVQVHWQILSSCARGKNVGFVSRMASPTTPIPARPRPGPLQGHHVPCSQWTGPWAQLLSAGQGDPWCPWLLALSADSPGAHSPAKAAQSCIMHIPGSPVQQPPGHHTTAQKKV